MSGICAICKRWDTLEQHHIFFGNPGRKLSTKYKLTANLCNECHQSGNKAVHRCRETDLQLKQQGQLRYMREQGAGKEEFMRVFGRNYLD